MSSRDQINLPEKEKNSINFINSLYTKLINTDKTSDMSRNQSPEYNEMVQSATSLGNRQETNFSERNKLVSSNKVTR